MINQQIPLHTVAPDVLTCADQQCSSIRYIALSMVSLSCSLSSEPSQFFLFLSSAHRFPLSLSTSPVPQYLCPFCVFSSPAYVFFDPCILLPLCLSCTCYGQLLQMNTLSQLSSLTQYSVFIGYNRLTLLLLQLL